MDRVYQEALAEKYPGLKLATIGPSDDDRDKAFAETQTILKVYPQVRLMMAISAPAVPGAAEAIRQAGRKDVDVIGLSLPSICKPYIHSGVVQAIVLWNTKDLGYLVVDAGTQLAQGGLQPGTHSLDAGRLGQVQVNGSEIVLALRSSSIRKNIDYWISRARPICFPDDVRPSRFRRRRTPADRCPEAGVASA